MIMSFQTKAKAVQANQGKIMKSLLYDASNSLSNLNKSGFVGIGKLYPWGRAPILIRSLDYSSQKRVADLFGKIFWSSVAVAMH